MKGKRMTKPENCSKFAEIYFDNFKSIGEFIVRMKQFQVEVGKETLRRAVLTGIVSSKTKSQIMYYLKQAGIVDKNTTKKIFDYPIARDKYSDANVTTTEKPMIIDSIPKKQVILYEGGMYNVSYTNRTDEAEVHYSAIMVAKSFADAEDMFNARNITGSLELNEIKYIGGPVLMRK